MKGLSLTQPWATMVAVGQKRIETRGWNTGYRGWIAVHAAKGFPSWARDFADELRAEGRIPVPASMNPQLPLGAIVAVARIIGVRRTEDVAYQIGPLEEDLGDYGPGRFAWFLDDVRALSEPIRCKGALGLWKIAPEVQWMIERALPQATGVARG